MRFKRQDHIAKAVTMGESLQCQVAPIITTISATRDVVVAARTWTALRNSNSNSNNKKNIVINCFCGFATICVAAISCHWDNVAIAVFVAVGPADLPGMLLLWLLLSFCMV